MGRGQLLPMVMRIFRTVVAAFLAASVVCSATLAAAEPKRVMVLHSFGRDFKPWSEYSRAIRRELDRQAPWPIEIIDQSLLTARSADENPEDPFADYLHALFAKRPLDLIVSIGAPAASFVQRRRQQLFATTPMVFTAVDQRRIQRSNLTPNDEVVAVRINFLAVVENILRILPDTKNVTVVLGASPIEQYWREQMDRELKPLGDRIAFTWTNDLSFEEILKHAAALPPRSAIFWALMSVDAAGVAHEGGVALTKLHASAGAPIFSYDDAFFGDGLVGGPHLSVTEVAQQVASVAIRIIGGEKAGDIKTPTIEFAAPIFDWRELQRWKISEARLPPGSEVRFREPTLWEQYHWHIIAVLAILLAQAAIIGWLYFERRRRLVAETELRRRLLEVIHLNRTALAGALSASVAHELNQPLGAILSYAEAGILYLKADPPNIGRVKEILGNIRRDDQRAADIISHLRGLLKKKDASELQEFDLNQIVRDSLQIVRPEALRKGMDISASASNGSLPVRVDQVHLQQAILILAMNGLDAMHNCTPGSGKMSIQTSLVEESTVEVLVADTGMGIPTGKLIEIFDPFYTTKTQGTGLGLSIARAIVETYGGKIWAENRPEGGAVFRFTLPLSNRLAG